MGVASWRAHWIKFSDPRAHDAEMMAAGRRTRTVETGTATSRR